jgi:sigma-54 dependent transcriptional regulator, acetoin dehydrogenase operon transcriptional activator AcoR
VVFIDNNQIFPYHLPDHIAVLAEEKDENRRVGPINLLENERTKIIDALQESRYNITKAAKQLGISRGTLYKKIEKYQIT